MKRLALRTIKAQAHINASTATHATYFPFFETREKIAYAAGIYGWNGSLYRGDVSGILYAVTDYGNDYYGAHKCRDLMGEREKYVLRTLDHVEEIEHGPNGYSVMGFYSIDGEHGFKVVTRDYGHNWEICG